MTHRDLRAEQGAMAIAAAAEYATTRVGHHVDWRDVMESVRTHVTEQELLGHFSEVERHLEMEPLPAVLASEMGLTRGVTGYINNTVPIALFCWLRYIGNYRESVTQAIRLGGDADTVGAITGALAGITVRRSGIPSEWIAGLLEWPRSVAWMDELADRLSRQFPGNDTGDLLGPQSLFWPGQFLRNVLFAIIVITHGFRRLLPPY